VLTHRSKCQKSRSHGYKNRHGRTVASDACCYGRVLLLPAWVCMSIRLPTFSSCNDFIDGAKNICIGIIMRRCDFSCITFKVPPGLNLGLILSRQSRNSTLILYTEIGASVEACVRRRE